MQPRVSGVTFPSYHRTQDADHIDRQAGCCARWWRDGRQAARERFGMKVCDGFQVKQGCTTSAPSSERITDPGKSCSRELFELLIGIRKKSGFGCGFCWFWGFFWLLFFCLFLCFVGFF